MKNTKKTTGVYASGEMKWMGWFHDFKGKLFEPFLSFLTGIGVTGNIVSATSGIVAICALVLAFAYNEPEVFLIGIWLHLFIDGFDGSLARYQKQQNRFGSFMDVVFDHVGITGCCLYALYFHEANPLLILLFGVFYTFVVFSAFLLGCIRDPFTFVLRPRIFVFATLTADYLWSVHTTDPVLAIVTAIMCVSTVQGLLKIGSFIRHTPAIR